MNVSNVQSGNAGAAVYALKSAVKNQEQMAQLVNVTAAQTEVAGPVSSPNAPNIIEATAGLLNASRTAQSANVAVRTSDQLVGTMLDVKA